MNAVDWPQQRQVVVVVEGGYRVELDTEGLDAALLGEQLADVSARVPVVSLGAGVVQDLPEDPEQRFLDLTLVGLHRMQAFNSPIPGSAHPADEHLDELIPSLGLGLMQEAQQQGVPSPRSADIA